MPNLQGTNLVSRDEGGRSYAAWASGNNRPGQATLWGGGLLGAAAEWQ